MGPHVPPLSCLSSSPGLGRPPCCLLFFGCARSSLGGPGLFVAARRIHLVVASRGYSRSSAWASVPGGFSCYGAWDLGHGLQLPACGILFPDQGLNLCALRWQAGRLLTTGPQGSPLPCSLYDESLELLMALPSSS